MTDLKELKVYCKNIHSFSLLITDIIKIFRQNKYFNHGLACFNFEQICNKTTFIAFTVFVTDSFQNANAVSMLPL